MLITLYCQGIAQTKWRELADYPKINDLEERWNGDFVIGWVDYHI